MNSASISNPPVLPSLFKMKPTPHPIQQPPITVAKNISSTIGCKKSVLLKKENKNGNKIEDTKVFIANSFPKQKYPNRNNKIVIPYT